MCQWWRWWMLRMPHQYISLKTLIFWLSFDFKTFFVLFITDFIVLILYSSSRCIFHPPIYRFLPPLGCPACLSLRKISCKYHKCISVFGFFYLVCSFHLCPLVIPVSSSSFLWWMSILSFCLSLSVRLSSGFTSRSFPLSTLAVSALQALQGEAEARHPLSPR